MFTGFTYTLVLGVWIFRNNKNNQNVVGEQNDSGLRTPVLLFSHCERNREDFRVQTVEVFGLGVARAEQQHSHEHTQNRIESSEYKMGKQKFNLKVVQTSTTVLRVSRWISRFYRPTVHRQLSSSWAFADYWAGLTTHALSLSLLPRISLSLSSPTLLWYRIKLSK